MSHWLKANFEEPLARALKEANRVQIYSELYGVPVEFDAKLTLQSANALEMVVLDLIDEGVSGDEEKQKELTLCASDAFRLLRTLPETEPPLAQSAALLRASALAVLGDNGVDAARWLKGKAWCDSSFSSESWNERTWATIIDVWLRLIRKDGWDDRDAVLERIDDLRTAQEAYEGEYLHSIELGLAKVKAIELVGLYHLAKAAEVFAHYMTNGVVDGKHQIQQLLEFHFDRVQDVCKQVQLIDLEPLSRLLAACSIKMAENSIWTVTRAVNSRVTAFVKTLVDRGRGNRAIFDVLPPQRRALADKGLLGSSRRSVVVSLPTSSGKTLIAQFRILQALNQFEADGGWVAYLAPTRTLVNQIAKQIRRDFAPLGISVEQVSPALEVDRVEAGLLQERDPKKGFRVLVTTPEKLDLMLRQGWEKKIDRPLTLVVVDEAHNLQSPHRGLKLELLLAVINSECSRAQFLLLTPFIDNAREVAEWLGGTNSEDISLAFDWQPNDRLIGVVTPKRGEKVSARSYGYSLQMRPVHTNRNTLAIDDELSFPSCDAIAATFSQASNQSALAAITAQKLQERGPVIIMHSRPDWVWSLASRLRIEENRTSPSPNIELAQAFLKLEFGESFPLIDMMFFGIGVHHAGLSDEVRGLMEWLLVEEDLKFLVATTTVAHGVNFPVSGVVMASHQYPYAIDMPPEDFWNIAGRAGRVDQGSLGVIALVASDDSKAKSLHTFIRKQTGELNSALISMAQEAGELMSDLKGIVYKSPEWSTFVQYLSHTYSQMGKPAAFADEVEHVLRGTFGFNRLRKEEPELAATLLEGIHSYSDYLQEPGQPLKLVDSTGFSLQSIRSVLAGAHEVGIGKDSWNGQALFTQSDSNLQAMMGVLLRVPELRENLEAVIGGEAPDGNTLALIIKDWVNGVSVSEISKKYFMGNHGDEMRALTDCGRNLYGRLSQTAAWGVGALLSITGGELDEEQMSELSNLPSRVYYGVNSDFAISLRLLGIPRSAATQMAKGMETKADQEPLDNVRERLRSMDEGSWMAVLGDQSGPVYRKVWRILEGMEPV